MVFCNWAGNVRFKPNKIAAPESVDELQALVRDTQRRGGNIRVVGAAHSFSRLIESTDILVSLHKLCGLIEVDQASQSATFWAGTPISALGPLLAPYGLALANQGDIDSQALAGAMSTGTHGTGIEFASLAGFMTRVEFVDGLGHLQVIDEKTDADLLNAVRVSMGLFGIFVRITIRCVASFILRDRRQKVLLEACLQELPQKIKEHRHYEFFWFPYSKYVQVKTCDITATSEPRNPVVRFIADDILERALYGSLCQVTSAFTRLSKSTSRLCGYLMPSADYADTGYKVYPSSRHVRFTEMEYAVLLEQGVACFLDLKKFIESQGIRVFFPVEFRVAGSDSAWLSSMAGRSSAIISLHVYRGVDQKRYFDGAEKIFKRYSGRPHWGKIHQLTPREISNLYPKWADFVLVRNQFDPDGVFLNAMLKAYVNP